MCPLERLMAVDIEGQFFKMSLLSFHRTKLKRAHTGDWCNLELTWPTIYFPCTAHLPLTPHPGDS